MRAIGYCRVSTDKQENSANAQEARIRAQATIKDLDLIEIITDLDEFSGDLNRPGMERILAMVRAKSIDAVICTKLDRVTRSTRDAIALIELFGKKQVSLISISESLDTVSPTGRFFVRMLASLAELEREMIGVRTREGLQYIKALGFPAGPAPFGWTAQARIEEERRLKIRKPLLENPAEQATIARIKELRAAGESLDRIAEILNAEGHRTRSGAPWLRQYVSGVLRQTARK